MLSSAVLYTLNSMMQPYSQKKNPKVGLLLHLLGNVCHIMYWEQKAFFYLENVRIYINVLLRDNCLKTKASFWVFFFLMLYLEFSLICKAIIKIVTFVFCFYIFFTLGMLIMLYFGKKKQCKTFLSQQVYTKVFLRDCHLSSGSSAKQMSLICLKYN